MTVWTFYAFISEEVAICENGLVGVVVELVCVGFGPPHGHCCVVRLVVDVILDV